MEIRQIDEATLAEYRHSFRQLYKKIGYQGMMQVLYELLKSAEMVTEVTGEELEQERKGVDAR